jgi:hypothetical protein
MEAVLESARPLSNLENQNGSQRQNQGKEEEQEESRGVFFRDTIDTN